MCPFITNRILRLYLKGDFVLSLLRNHQRKCSSTRGLSCSKELDASVEIKDPVNQVTNEVRERSPRSPKKVTETSCSIIRHAAIYSTQDSASFEIQSYLYHYEKQNYQLHIQTRKFVVL